MKKKITAMVAVVVATLCTTGMVRAVSMTVDSLTVGKQGVGGVTYFNGTIVNRTTGTGGADNPVTFGDNVRIDGRIYRGATAGTGDTLPVIVNDNMEVAGSLTAASLSADSLTLGGDLAVGGVTYLNGTIVNSATGNEGANNPVTFGDNVRIDGEVYRGATAGPSDSLPFKINDNVTISGDQTVSGSQTVSGDQTVSGSQSVNGNLTVGGSITQAGSPLTKYLSYVGTFNVNQAGDEVTTDTWDTVCSDPSSTRNVHYHWKKIAVPEVDLNRMPSIKVYNRLAADFDIFPNSGDVWVEMSSYSLAAYTQGYVYILYKTVYEYCDGSTETTNLVTGEYKIVIINT